MSRMDMCEEIQLSNPDADVTVTEALRVCDEAELLVCRHMTREIVYVCDRAFFQCTKCEALRSIE